MPRRPTPAGPRGLDEEHDLVIVRAGQCHEIIHEGGGPGRLYQELGTLRRRAAVALPERAERGVDALHAARAHEGQRPRSGRRRFQTARPARDRQPVVASDAAVVEALRAWRLEQSRSQGKPAFVIFSDATLEAIAAAMPSTAAALAEVKGIGPMKLDAYGDDVLAIVDEHRAG